jgi:hypothetical protein
MSPAAADPHLQPLQIRRDSADTFPEMSRVLVER